MKHIPCRVISGYLQAKPPIPYDSATACLSDYSRNVDEKKVGEREGRRERKLRIKQALHLEEPLQPASDHPKKKVPFSQERKVRCKQKNSGRPGWRPLASKLDCLTPALSPPACASKLSCAY